LHFRGCVGLLQTAVPLCLVMGRLCGLNPFEAGTAKIAKRAKKNYHRRKPVAAFLAAGACLPRSGGGLAILSYKPAPVDLLAAQPV